MRARSIVVHSKAKQVAGIMRSEIIKKNYSEDVPLQTEAELMEKFSVGRSSIREALAILESEKLVRRTAGRGTFALKKQRGKNVLFILSRDEHTNLLLIGPLLKALNPIGGNLSVAHPEDIVQKLRQKWSPEYPHSFIDTLVCYHTYYDSDSCISQALEASRNTPVRPLFVFLDDEHPDLHVDKITLDLEKANCKIAERLVEHGHREFLYIGKIDSADGPVLRGIKSVLSREKGTSLSLINYEDRNYTRFLAEIFSKEIYPTVVVGQNDFFATIAMKIILSKGLRVPEDVSIVGQHNTPWCLQVNPFLTSTGIEEEEFITAVHSILMEGESECRIFFRPVYRESTGELHGGAKCLVKK